VSCCRFVVWEAKKSLTCQGHAPRQPFVRSSRKRSSTVSKRRPATRN
jgi:hypothetical protein